MPLDSHSLSLARLAANRANAQLSTGPKSAAGRAAVSQNRWRHGLTGEFMTLACESEEDFDQLVTDLRAEHQPSTPTEKLLVDRLAQHHWLMQRALGLQSLCFNIERPICDEEKQLALYMRYQTTHERAFYKCLRELATLRAERKKVAKDEAALSQRSADRFSKSERAEDSSKVGFESQKRAEAAEYRKNLDEMRKQAAEIRHQELHSARLNRIAAQIAPKSPRQLAPTSFESPDIELKTAA